MRVKQSLESLLKQHEGVFKDKLGTLKGMKAKLHVDPQAKSLFHKAHTVPFALRDRVELELERLERQDIIAPITFSDWAAPIMPAEKRDGSVRICGDYKPSLEDRSVPHTEDKGNVCINCRRQEVFRAGSIACVSTDLA